MMHIELIDGRSIRKTKLKRVEEKCNGNKMNHKMRDQVFTSIKAIEEEVFASRKREDINL